MDVRVKRTQVLLAEAFDSLIGEKPVDKITVSELCDRATVRRATFYKHFDDMRDFTRYYLTTLTDRFMTALSQDNDLEDLFVYAERMHVHMLEYFDANKALFRHLMGTDMMVETMDLIIMQVADGIITRAQALVDSGEAKPRATAKVVGTYYSAGLTHTMRRRLLYDNPQPIEDVVADGMAILRDMLGIP